MGAGAATLLSDAELRSVVSCHGSGVGAVVVDAVDEEAGEMARIIELDRRLARAVHEARSAGSFPLVVAGNCISCVGTVGGCRGTSRLGVIWLDAHADFDTPEDNLSGFSDVMGLSILTGTAWQALSQTVPGFWPVDERDVVLGGTRDLADYQRDRLSESQTAVVPGQIDPRAFAGAIASLKARVDGVYLHVDLDVLDTTVGRANAYAADGGPCLPHLLERIGEVFAMLDVKAAAITAYDPASDPSGRILDAARQIAGEIAVQVGGKDGLAI